MFHTRKEPPALIGAAAPLAGRLFPLHEVNDDNFSRGYMGDGVAIEPSSNCVMAPFDGTISQIAQTKHALLLRHDSELQLLIHIGLDTFDLQGQGFDLQVGVNDRVRMGQPLVTFDPALIVKADCPTCVIFIAISNEHTKASVSCEYREIGVGEPDAFRIELHQVT
ncbi:PTS glucose transporter subunit IIA [Paenibacillus sp. 1P07SE]|uniref:PTS sugar transporter subunit IIA n=1 Tax=Paenibacillus sp. 1P07SE TaxID=3132209 RepID=UPI0039A45402